ncbi:MAG TPA: transglutaminaseTgpA domain-containing protein [Acidimicrobiales bacterium]|nr:transglutaminaseTgpA domain-containing protein [Acidimicrobiales bacterium]
MGMIKTANAKHDPESSIALRASVLVAVLAATLATTAQGVGGAPLRIAATFGIAAGFGYSHWARHRDGYLLKAMLAVGVLLAFGGFLQAATGLQAGAINEVQIPLAELFLWVQFFHSLDVPARRDLLFSLLSSLVLIAVAGVLSVSAALGPNLIVWGIATVVSLVLAHRSEVRSLPQLLGADAPPGRDGRWGRARTPSLRPIMGILALVAVLGAAMFLIVPAAGAGRAVAFPARLPNAVSVPNRGGLANPSLGRADPSGDGETSSTGTSNASGSGYFGFSKKLDTGSRGRPDGTLVMRVKASRPDFWRGQSFDLWDGRTWTQSDDRPTPTRGDAPLQLQGAPEDRAAGIFDAGTDFVQTVFVEQAGPNLIFAAYAPDRVYFSDRTLFELSDGTVRTAVQLPRGAVYTVVSRRTPVTADLLRESDGLPVTLGPALQARYTQLPVDVPGRVTDLAASVTDGAPTTLDKVRALEQWMADNTRYTLDIPRLAPGADAVEQYLFVDKQGFCEQIGTALVVMLRSLGIPARLAVGFTPGERNPFTGLWEVRARDAHAWAEVWFPGIGWQSFDPTASVPFAGDPYSSAAGAGLAGFIKGRLPSIPSWLPDAATLVVVVGIPFGTLGWMATQRRRRRREWDAMPWAAQQLVRLERAGAARGRSRKAWESASRYADVLALSVLPDPRVRTLAELLEADAFAGGVPSHERRIEAEQLLEDLEHAHPAPR